MVLHTKMEMIRQQLNAFEMEASSTPVDTRLFQPVREKNAAPNQEANRNVNLIDRDTQTLRFELVFESF